MSPEISDDKFGHFVTRVLIGLLAFVVFASIIMFTSRCLYVRLRSKNPTNISHQQLQEQQRIYARRELAGDSKYQAPPAYHIAVDMPIPGPSTRAHDYSRQIHDPSDERTASATETNTNDASFSGEDGTLVTNKKRLHTVGGSGGVSNPALSLDISSLPSYDEAVRFCDGDYTQTVPGCHNVFITTGL